MIGIYARVSTSEQAEHGYSIRDQIDKCRSVAKNDDVIEYVDPGVSGEFLDRPAMNKLRQDIKDGLIDKVICYDPDRLSRKLVNQLIITQEIERKGELVFVNSDYKKTPEGIMFYQMRGAFAEYEKAKINERLSNGRKRKAREGKVVRDPHVYGYNWTRETSKFEINEEEAKIVRLIFDLFTNQKVAGLNGVAHYLTDHMIPTKKRVGQWHRQVVRQIIKNEIYVGNYYNNKWNTEGMLGNKHRPADEKIAMKLRPREEWILVKCPAIIDEPTFRLAQQLMGQARRRWANIPKHQYMLSGLLRCGYCGNVMTGRKSRNWGTDVLEYTDRKNTAGAKEKGCGQHVNARRMEEDVWTQINEWLNNPKELIAASKETEQPSTFETSELELIENEIEKVKESRTRLIELFSEGIDGLSKEDIRSSLKSFKEREDQLTKRLREIKDSQKQAEDQQHSESLYRAVIAECLEKSSKGELTFEDKKQIIRMIVKEIIIYHDNYSIKLL
jgi:site-specific DNA recombinase